MTARYFLGLLLVCTLGSALATAQQNQLVSVATNGMQSGAESRTPYVSADGRYVVYASLAGNLTPNDLNGTWDVFWHDLLTGVTKLVSVTPAGFAGDGMSLAPVASGDGRLVVYQSRSTNLVAGGGNTHWDIYARDILTGVTAQISLDRNGNQTIFPSERPRITPDGRFVTFESLAPLIPADTNLFYDAYRLDRSTGQLVLVSVAQGGGIGNGSSTMAVPSDDGRFVGFKSAATNFVAGDTNQQDDLFRKDTLSGQVRRVNLSTTGVQADDRSGWPVISGDGSTVCFISQASSLVAGLSNGFWNLFAHDVASGVTTQLNVQPSGMPSQLWVNWISPPAVSSSGRYVLFASWASDLVVGDTNNTYDVFLRDRVAQVTTRVSLAFDGSEANGESRSAHMTGDAGVVAFDSEATNIVSGDTNGERDVFASYNGGSLSTFCTAKTGLVCGVPSITGWGFPSATAGSSFTVSAGPARSCKAGLLLYNTSQVAALAFQGGSLCIQPQGLRRAGSTNSGGTPGSTQCDGYFTIDMNTFAAGAWVVPNCDGTPSAIPANTPAAFLSVSGTPVYAAFWGRDSTSTGSFVSDGLNWTVAP